MSISSLLFKDKLPKELLEQDLATALNLETTPASEKSKRIEKPKSHSKAKENEKENKKKKEESEDSSEEESEDQSSVDDEELQRLADELGSELDDESAEEMDEDEEDDDEAEEDENEEDDSEESEEVFDPKYVDIPQDAPSDEPDTEEEEKKKKQAQKEAEEAAEAAMKSKFKPGETPRNRARRTVFVGNLPLDITTKQVKKLFSKFGPIDSIRFRGIAFKDGEKIPAKINAIKEDYAEGRNSKNAYIVFSEIRDAKKALEMNNTEVGGKHIRVDRESKKMKDTKQTVFVGNLPRQIEDEELRAHFEERCGPVTAVRIIRDELHLNSKGFGYVTFEAREGYKAALKLNEKTELGGRTLRVFRALAEDKLKKHKEKSGKKGKGKGKEKGKRRASQGERGKGRGRGGSNRSRGDSDASTRGRGSSRGGRGGSRGGSEASESSLPRLGTFGATPRGRGSGRGRGRGSGRGRGGSASSRGKSESPRRGMKRTRSDDKLEAKFKSYAKRFKKPE